jgi:predicted nucleic acid-binding Zn ribbon protein
MSGKRYTQECIVCREPYVAKRAGSHCCSNKCRAKLSRDKKRNIGDELRRFSVELLYKVLKDAYERGEREISLNRDLDPFLSRKDWNGEVSFGVNEFSVRKIEGKAGVYKVVKKY